MAGQQSVNHYCIGLNDSTSHSTVKYSLLWFSLYTKPPYKSCPCATAIMYVTSARQVNNPQRHPWYDWQIHIVAASTYGTYFLDMHGLQTFGVFSTIKTHFVCFSLSFKFGMTATSSAALRDAPTADRWITTPLIFVSFLWPPTSVSSADSAYCFLHSPGRFKPSPAETVKY